LTATTTPDHMLTLEPLVAQPADTVDFMARREELRLTLKARYPQRNPVTGASEGVTQGIFAGFREGLLRLPKTGTARLVDTLDGGVHEMPAEDVLELLRKHRLFGDRSEGFWLVEHPAPSVSQDELDRLLDAAARWDEEQLATLLDQERAGWAREDVIRVAEGALERISAMRAEVEVKALEVERAAAEDREARERAEATVAAAVAAQKKAEAALKAEKEKK
jgi:hypothetical protein